MRGMSSTRDISTVSISGQNGNPRSAITSAFVCRTRLSNELIAGLRMPVFSTGSPLDLALGRKFLMLQDPRPCKRIKHDEYVAAQRYHISKCQALGRDKSHHRGKHSASDNRHYKERTAEFRVLAEPSKTHRKNSREHQGHKEASE